ncbi:MAG: GWxTD domain-containing protein [Candidatus Eisenbacteria bacterium]|nr:GWxTD domain-containing protein [Candidatus Eisenbacteria bacterium]
MRRALLVILVLLTALAAGTSRAIAGEKTRPDPSEDRFFSVILSEGQRLEYENLPAEQREAWRVRFWAERDPTPTTDENQRLEEHEKRVRGAILQFHDKNGEFVFDDRVRAWIRFGQPKNRESMPGEVVVHEGMRPPREFWLYDDMILWFEDRWLNGNFIEGLSTNVSSIASRDQYLREDTGWSVDEQLEFEESFNRFLEVNDIDVDPVLAQRMTDDGKRNFESLPEINDYDYGGAEEFRFLFDLNFLAGSGERTDLLIGFLIPLDKFDREVEEGREAARIQRRASISDADYRLVDRRVENLVHRFDPIEGGGGWVVTSDSFTVDPGVYHLALRVIDLRSKNHGILKTEVTAPDFGGGEARLSDLVFAAAVTRDERGEGAFLRRGFRIVPRPIRVYAPGEDVNVYFELYNLTLGPGGRGVYEITYTLYGSAVRRFSSLLQGSDEGMLEQGVSQTFESFADDRTVSRHISLDTNSLPPDRYTLIVDVTDKGSGSADRKTAQFVVQR